MIVIESVDYQNGEITITDGKRSVTRQVKRDGSISRMFVGLEVDMTYERFAELFFTPKCDFYTPVTPLSCVGYYDAEMRNET